MYRLAVGLTIGLMLTVAAISEADNSKQKNIHGSFAGSFSPSNFDPNNDGAAAGLNLVTGKGNLGPFTSQLLWDLSLPLAAPVTCPAGTVEYPYFGSLTVATYSTEDQIISGEEGAGTFCVNTSTGAYTFDVTEDIFASTGKFTGATGTVEFKGTGIFGFCDPKNRCMGSVSGKYTGTLIVP